MGQIVLTKDRRLALRLTIAVGLPPVLGPIELARHATRARCPGGLSRLPRFRGEGRITSPLIPLLPKTRSTIIPRSERGCAIRFTSRRKPLP